MGSINKMVEDGQRIMSSGMGLELTDLGSTKGDLLLGPGIVCLNRKLSEKVELRRNEAARETWDSPFEFLLSCISMSVGLGNIWRFPTTCARNGGGAFLIPYLIVLLVIGRPLYFLEMCLGQFSKYGQVKVWNMAPICKGVGYGSCLGVICVASYYVALLAITIYYFFVSFTTGDLPWSTCPANRTFPAGVSCSEGHEASYYYYHVVFPQIHDLDNGLGRLNWKLAICLGGAWALIFLSLVRGVKSSGKVAYITAIFPYIILIILLIRGVTLKGAWIGIRKFIEPEWRKLLDPKVWYNAVEQVFLSLSTGYGPVIMFSSFNSFNHNVYKDALILSFMDTSASLIAGVTVFAVMGNLMQTTGLKFEEIQGGPGLAFVLYPQAIANFGWAPQLFAILFFLMLLTLGVGSAVSFVGGVVTIICDQFPSWKRWLVTTIVCMCGVISGLIYITEGGMLMLDFVDHYGSGFVIYMIAIVECAGVSYVYGLRNFCNDLEFMLGYKVGLYWKACWAGIIPFGLFSILVYYLATEPEFASGGVPYPRIATVCGWLLTTFAVGQIVFWGVHAIMTRKGITLKEKFIESLKPTHRWGPQNPELRRAWLAHKAGKEAKLRKESILIL